MNIEELKDKLNGVYDFDEAKDCQKVITMLLRDLVGANKRAEHAVTQMKMLAMMVVRGRQNARKKAEDIIRVTPRLSSGEVMEEMERMSREMESANGLTDEQLVNDVLRHVWGDLDFTGRPSAVLEEMICRYKKMAGIEKDNAVTGDVVS